MFSGLIGLAKWAAGSLFGGSGRAEKETNNAMEIAKGIGGFIDEQNFTPEEAAKMHAANQAALHAHIQATQNENSVRSVTRRYLAWSIMGTSIFLLLLSVILLGFDQKELVKDIKELYIAYKFDWLTIAVGSFYFAVQFKRK